MTADLAVGDWIVYVGSARGGAGASPVLGGPWRHAQLLKKGVDGWTVKAATQETFVMTRDITHVCLSRGEAIIIVDKLADIQNEFIRERDALKPRFQDRVDAILKNK